MGAGAGAAMRFGQTGLRAIQLLASILVLGIFSYFLAVLAHHHLPEARWIKAVEGISGAAVLYGFFCVFLTLFLGGIGFFGFIAVALDICFVGCYVAITILTRHGANSCSGVVHTPIGFGVSNSSAPGYGNDNFGFGSNVTTAGYTPNLHRACKLETAAFAVSLLNIFLFLVTAAVQILLVRHHRKEKRFGPSPTNNYTSGSGKTPFWRRNRRGGALGSKKSHNTRDAEMATAGTATTAGMRPSHDTGYTGNTLAGTTNVDETKYGQPGYGQAHTTGHY